MGRTEFLTETDCERALVGRAKAKASTRAKWRSSSSACRRVLEKCLTPPTLLEMAIYHQPCGFGLESVSVERLARIKIVCVAAAVVLSGIFIPLPQTAASALEL